MEPEAGRHIHESPRAMTVPLIILAVLAAVSGFVGLRVLPGERADLFGRFLGQVLPRAGRYPAPSAEIALILAATASALLGIGLAFLFYRRSPGLPARLAGRFPGAYRLLVNGYSVDAAYDAVVVRPLVKGAGWAYRNLDLRLIDGALDGSAAGADLAGRGLSALQSGLVRDYALAFLLGAVIFLGVLLL